MDEMGGAFRARAGRGGARLQHRGKAEPANAPLATGESCGETALCGFF